MFIGIGAARTIYLRKHRKYSMYCLMRLTVGRERGAGVGGGNDEVSKR
jgi:ATP-dependent Zn protease